MGAVDTPQKADSGGKGKKKKRRIGIRIDMTPMVDIAFLLLIFYMVTTVFAAPQAMEINLPEDSDEPIKIKKCDLLIVHVDGADGYWWSLCEDGPIQFKEDSLRTLFYSTNKDNPKLSTLIVIHPDAKYNDFVNILDEIEVVEYVLREDEEFVAYYREANKDVLAESATFSYRYSTKPWDPKDDAKIEKAKSGSLLGGGGS
ncbi:MAG: biopolymer transporter ExbD [candidate division Zixibacteria bacterium]|nr:biopolymer transporter ExbD [candidate division Zixibacteria bacterium]MBU1471234.1 biopolymer transporter ExbD [candidate division Zixibacteria bacterium]MBU2624936.1 biopolymer transporter ExbD [candidate division Zixibacteria bacterium]